MIKTLREAVTGVWSMLVGLKVTGKSFFQPQITVHYPRQTVESLEGYRGHIELVPRSSDPYRSKCIACGTCVKLCPSHCITLKVEKPPVPGKKVEVHPPDIDLTPLNMKQHAVHPRKMDKHPRTFNLDFNFCSLCGLCVQNCPSKALRFSNDVYIAGYSRKEFEYDLLARLRRQAQKKEH